MLLQRLSTRLGHSQARLELKWLTEHATKAKVSLEELVERRMRDEPLQYILGTQPFGPLSLLVRPPVLIPRPETEHWALRLTETVMPSVSKPISVLDIGTGSGCIPLLLSHGVDISEDALQLAQENAKLHGFSPTATGSASTRKNTFTTVQASVLSPSFTSNPLLTPPYDIVTSNPPYISFLEFLELPASVAKFEDPRALFGGATNGLDFYGAIAKVVAEEGFLKKSVNARVVLEVGWKQASDVRDMLHATGRFDEIEIWKDPWDKERTVVGVAR
ncbi:S-adenosyl-L-methionine-dependent methyltransferase [Hymenopellis radicata]|nr:S-adenosyl-L-methionine-dependent methyltransferase [Hymenopellis radicata]